MDNSLVTVLMPVYNGEKYIHSSVESILSQTFRDFELVIINDASSDDSVKIINSFKDSRVRLLNNQKRLGLAKSRQRGVRESKGKYIAFMDSDDISLPHRLITQLNFLEKNKEISMVGSWVKVIDEKGNINRKTWKHAVSAKIIPSILLFRNCFTQSSIFLKKDCLRHFSFRQEFWAAPDYDLWNRLAQKYQLANLPQVLVYYRIFPSNMSAKAKKEIIECTKKIQKENLGLLDVNVTDEELMIHDFFERESLEVTNEILNIVYRWLTKLIMSNKKVSRFNQAIFEYVCANYWFKACSMGGKRGMEVFNKYINLPLIQDRQTKLLKKIILLSSCLLRRKTVIDVTSEEWIVLTNRNIL